MIVNLINQLDIFTLNFIEQIRTPSLTLFFKAVTTMGEWSFVLGVLFFYFPIFHNQKRFRYDLVLWPVTVGGLGTAFVLKEIIHRSRPLGAIVAETSSSFPSAHAITSVAFYAFIFICWLETPSAVFPDIY